MEWFKTVQWFQFFLAGSLLLIGFLLAKVASLGVEKLAAKKLNKHNLLLAKRAVYYGILLLFIITALQQLGAKLGVLLGAAGVFSVAIGFASQTSASNLISGLFVLVENTFEVGDVIKIGSTVGEVLSIDWLSVKLRTFDNLLVRIPNEAIIKSELTNITKFPIRRIDIKFVVAYYTDLVKLEKTLLQLADDYVKSLEEPEPLFSIDKLNELGIAIQFSFWVKKENMALANNTIIAKIVKALPEQGIHFGSAGKDAALTNHMPTASV